MEPIRTFFTANVKPEGQIVLFIQSYKVRGDLLRVIIRLATQAVNLFIVFCSLALRTDVAEKDQGVSIPFKLQHSFVTHSVIFLDILAVIPTQEP